MAEDMENQDEFAQLLAAHESRSDKLQVGQKVKGKIIAMSGDDAFIDVGVKEDGVMDAHELMDKSGEIAANIGDEVEAFVVAISSQGIRLSRSMSGSGLFALEEAQSAAIPVEGRVKSVCKGGYQVEILGKTAFCPASQMQFAENGEDLVGSHMMFLITRIENHGRNIVVSHRALVEKEREENFEKLMQSIKVGDVLEGKITRIAPFGVFVELAPEVEGMVHLSELSWSHVADPHEAVQEGEQIAVKLLEAGRDDKGRLRISLSRKQAMGDPWETLAEKFKPGDTVEGIVRRLAPFGAFVEFCPGVEGLVHLSEMAWGKRINKAEDVLNVGQTVHVKIKDINPEEKRVSLSLRDAAGDPWEDVEQKFAPGTQAKGIVESKSPYGLFISLMPGITGLLPMSAIKNADKSAGISGLNPGDEINIVIQKVDCAAKRISLALENPDSQPADTSWKAHAKSFSPDSGASSGIMADAFKKAFQKKQQGDKNA